MIQDAWSLQVWLPALVILTVGIVTAFLMTRQLRPTESKKRKQKNEQEMQDLRLEIADLGTRRDELYLRLRGELEEVELSEAERRTLEGAAARVLRDLDDAQERLAALGGGVAAKSAESAAGVEDKDDSEATTESSVDVPNASRGPSPVLAFGFGVGLTALMAVLFFLATQDAKQGPRDGPAPRNLERSPEVSGRAAGGDASADHPPAQGQIPPQLQAQLNAAQQRVDANPNDIPARKELALTQVQSGLLMEAFDNANVLLQADSEDPDGLYVHGVVRLAMGQSEQALELVDRVLSRYPDHLLALMIRGAALLRMNDSDGAIATWEQALAVTGGNNPDIEFLIRQARAGVGFAGPESGAQAAPPAQPPPPQADPQIGASTVYTIDVDLADGATGRGVLFLSIRTDPSSPPTAVRRIDNPRFPITLTLGPDNSMMGQPLPDAGIVRAKLDVDGSVASNSPDDLRGEAQASVGGRVAILLSRQ